MGGLTRRSALVMAAVAGTAAFTARPAQAADAVNGPWLVDVGWGLLQVDRSNPDPPVKVFDRGRDFATSRDGRYAAFIQNLTPTSRINELFVLDRVTGDVRQVTSTGIASLYMSWPTWSPDGTRVALVYANNLYVVDVATGALTLAHSNRPIHHPAWSPDGSRIAFYMQNSAGLGALYSLKLSTGRLTEVLVSLTADEMLSYPTWTPDSNKLIFVTRRWAERSEERIFNDLGFVHRDGTGLRRLTTESNYYVSPVYAPDNSQLAVLGVPPENTEPDGGNIRVFKGDFSKSWWVAGDEYDDSVRLAWPPALP